MRDRNIYNTISAMDGVSNFHERETPHSVEDITYYEFGFDFSDMRYIGSQITSPLFTLNRLNLLFRYTLKKDTTKANLLDAINKYNSERPLIKIALTEISGKKIEVTFSSDFIADDDKISASQMVPLVNIMAPSPEDFVRFLSQKKIILSHT
ncbi:MAG: hypothetical protein ACN6P2_08975 [Pseudomonas palmensis]|uniref:hypothetical protein n=1 Tax=Pseudomonas palmensis TaxID=2815362 RepID=UPI003D0BDE8F